MKLYRRRSKFWPSLTFAAARNTGKNDVSSGSHRLEDQAGVAAAEAEGIGDGDANVLRSGLIGDVTEVALRIGIVEVDCRRQGAALDGDETCQRFDGGGAGQHVAGHAFGRADGHVVDSVTKDFR